MADNSDVCSVQPVIIKDLEFYRKLDEYYLAKPKKKPYSRKKARSIIEEIKIAKDKKNSKEGREYHLLSTYDVMTIGNKTHLIRKSEDVKKIEYIVSYEDIYERIYDIHIAKTGQDIYERIYDIHIVKTGHDGRSKMEQAFAAKFQIPRPALEIFLTCPRPALEIF
ncbi:hypothetical protein QE152_g6092 [Popillia japonica]|uniref:Uncharacterized protein n=1 Tax=Popillia japonica TaxID=7064 RepID=A0AAW1MIA4_POPJA